MKTNYKKSLEFLFYGIDPMKQQHELVQIIEEGFSEEEHPKHNICPYAALTNSILSCDAYRIKQSLKFNQEMLARLPNYLSNKMDLQSVEFMSPGIILICKVLIFKSVED